MKLEGLIIKMWKHYCLVEKEWLKVGKGHKCNWCDIEEVEE